MSIQPPYIEVFYMIQLLEDKPTQIKIISINFMSMVSPIIDA
jgi:hypothetical protein